LGKRSGGFLSFGIVLTERVSADPWEHAIASGVGAYAGTALVAWEERTLEEVQTLMEGREAKIKPNYNRYG